MSKIENRCIAYIYNEMDPTERLEFERELQTDENLLIELESLKRVAGCLYGLKCMEPPESVVNSVKVKAESASDKNTQSGSFKYLFASAALTLIAVMIYGAATLQDQQSAQNAEKTESGTAVSSLSTSGEWSGTSNRAASDGNEISPWVDHDEIIHFHEKFNRGSVASVDSMFNNSLNKLTRVNEGGTLQQVPQQIHLTGGNR